MIRAFISIQRQNLLRTELRRVANLLKLKRAGEISESVINELVLLSWLEWFGGSLRLTTTGANICRQQ